MDDTENGQDDIAQDQPEPGWAKALRKELAEAKKQLAAKDAEIASRDRSALFDRVGITGKTGELFRKSYDGPLDEAAVKAAALEYGLIEEQRTTPTEEAEVLNRISDSLAGAKGPSDFLSADVDNAVSAAINAIPENAEDLPQQVDAILKRHGLKIYDS